MKEDEAEDEGDDDDIRMVNKWMDGRRMIKDRYGPRIRMYMRVFCLLAPVLAYPGGSVTTAVLFFSFLFSSLLLLLLFYFYFTLLFLGLDWIHDKSGSVSDSR